MSNSPTTANPAPLAVQSSDCNASASPVADPLAAASDQHSALCTLNSALKDHALRRWRAYLPRPHLAPEADPSWRDECPCGKPLPCTEHPDLYLRARYLKPHHPDYASVLNEAGLPSYTPTAEELGCSEDIVTKMKNEFRRKPPIKS